MLEGAGTLTRARRGRASLTGPRRGRAAAGYGYWIWRVALRLFAGLENRIQKQENRKPNGGESVSSAVASGGLFTLTGRYDSAVCLRTPDALVPAAYG